MKWITLSLTLICAVSLPFLEGSDRAIASASVFCFGICTVLAAAMEEF